MNLLITGAWSAARTHIPKIESMGHQVVFMQQEKDSLPCDYAWVEGIICNGLFLTHPIERFVNLHFIQLTSAGYDRVPMDYVKKKQLTIHNARGVYSIPMAEHALAGVLALYRRLPMCYENQTRREWIKQRDCLELCGKTVAIVGCGSVGDECAKRFMAFDCHVLGLNRTVRDNPHYHEILGLDQLDVAIERADILVISVPLTQETFHLINEERLSRMKRTAILVNVSRGAVVDTQALETAMPKIGGAVLDVFEQEPLGEESLLWSMKNILITPHNSFVGEKNQERLAQVILKHL